MREARVGDLCLATNLWKYAGGDWAMAYYDQLGIEPIGPCPAITETELVILLAGPMRLAQVPDTEFVMLYYVRLGRAGLQFTRTAAAPGRTRLRPIVRGENK